MNLSSLIAALSSPDAYPFAVAALEVRQTHISVVFLTGDYAYKVKKPVDLGFADFSTLARREHFCREELRLNRRLAPHVYLDVVPVTDDGGRVRLEGSGPVIDWAVKMQRLPPGATLRERLRRGALDSEVVERLARRIATFHQGQESSRAPADFGAVARILRGIFDEAAPQAGTTLPQGLLDRLRRLMDERLDHLRPLIDQRARRGMTREGHGDLHLDHVYFFPDAAPPDDLVIVDCIEFNPRLRHIDPVADVAFTIMDLAYCDRRDLARLFTETYFAATADDEGRALLPLYTGYRATVRGLVEGMKQAEPEVPEAEKAQALESARAHWLLALGQLEQPGCRPCLVLVAGLPGAGKSTLARGLAAAASFEVIRSDVVRKELVGTPLPDRATLYSRNWDERTYAECLRRAEEVLMGGGRVLVDASFREEGRRRAFLDAAARWAVPGVLLVCSADAATVQRRLEQRRNDASDADWAVHQHLAARWQEPAEETRQVMHPIATDGSAAEASEQALAVLRELGLYEP